MLLQLGTRSQLTPEQASVLFPVNGEFAREEGKDRRPAGRLTAESAMVQQNVSWASCPCCEIVIDESERGRSGTFACPNCRFEWSQWQSEPVHDVVVRHRENLGTDVMAKAFARAAANELLGACRLALSFIREGSPSQHSCPKCASWFHSGHVGPCFCACHLVESAIAKAEGNWPVLERSEKHAAQETTRK